MENIVSFCCLAAIAVRLSDWEARKSRPSRDMDSVFEKYNVLRVKARCKLK